MKKIKIWCNLNLLVKGITFCTIGLLICIFFVIFLENTEYTQTPEDKIVCQLLWEFLAISIVLSSLFCLPRWGTMIILSSNTIKYQRPFSKAYISSYNSYPYIYRGFYMQRHLFFKDSKVIFIILSQTKMTEQELTHVNRISSRKEIIKIRYNPKIFQRLQNFLPILQRKRIERSFEL